MTQADKQALPDQRSEAAGDTPAGEAFPIVGIGASAGGLKAAEAFLDAMPGNSGMAFVMVQHLDPDHESVLADLLQNHTTMKVSQVAEDSPVQPDHVYVIPPKRSLAIRDGVLVLAELDQPRGRPAVIDQFFRSLADDRRHDAIGIVLSGSGTEGAKGLAAIKERGGITMAQDETEAEYSSMPSNAIASGCVDLVLPVAQMPSKLLEVTGHAGDFNLRDDDAPLEQGEVATLDAIFAQVRSSKGHDFSDYRRGMMLRRIGRRMRLRSRTNLTDYLAYLRENESEVETLFGEFLISVTGFFRDEEATQALESKVIPKLFEGRGEDETVRVWVPGCATGEEAYSLAILLAEASASLERPPAIQIFATDIDEAALATARAGRYRDTIAQEVSTKRLDRFFIHEGGSYRVGKALREMILFSRHNLLQDPPFAKLDLISCRNVLIYLTEEIQAKVFAFFHFALRPGGYLFLGTSESLSQAVEKFSDVDRKARLFRRREGAAAVRSFPTPVPGAARSSGSRSAGGTGERRGNGERPQRFLLERFAPPCVIVDENWCITYVSGRVGKYLEHAVGKPTQDILELAREGLGLELRLALAQAARSGTPAVRRGKVGAAGGWHEVLLTVEPIPDSGGMLMVAFDGDKSPGQEQLPAQVPHEKLASNGESAAEPDSGGVQETGAKLIAEIEAELKSSKALLQATIDDLETANEELRAANEELQSMNEEMQSTGEELQTSQEELQSTNEELVTVNQELHSKVGELSESNSVLDNLGASTNIATV
ncbi:MAG: chemotaxis protein CheB, partial [Trueperaceae bacterium]